MINKVRCREVDFLIVYETRVRELENICLLKCELELRGYTVTIINTWNELAKENRGPKFCAKVVITPSMYNNGIYDFIKDLCGTVSKIVNLQWEQIGTFTDEGEDSSRYVLRGMAHQCMNICWGEKTFNRLIQRSKIDTEHVIKTGQIALDFCRSFFRSYYMTREQVYKKYMISAHYEINLFISSFAYVNLPEKVYNEYKGNKTDEFRKVSIESFNTILIWFKKLLDEKPNQAIVYRPHPAEASNLKLLDFVKQYPERFKVICELSVKQWILVSDRVFTWYSTSIAEAFALGVSCSILRPTKIPIALELILYDNAILTKTYDAFVKMIDIGNFMALNKNIFKQHYDIIDTPSYVRVADAVEKVFKDDKYLIKDARHQEHFSIYKEAKQLIYSLVAYLARNVFKTTNFLEHFREKVEIDEYTKERIKSNYASQEEIMKIQNKLFKIIDVERKQ